MRIREISFPVDDADRVIGHVRDTTVARYGGEGYRGSRLLVDRDGGTALEVSYWRDEVGARGGDPMAGAPDQEIDPTGVPGGVLVRTRCYELAIDAG